ncbi:MAG: YdcF family protein [Clostridia bacterium]|nr:YdcF family protein [Clostridia bacterium]
MKLFFCLAGLLCLAYYLLWAVRVSPRASILVFWLLLGGCFFLFAAFPLTFLILMPCILLFFGTAALLLYLPRSGQKEEPELLLVLGVRCDGTLPEALFRERVNEAARLLHASPNLKCILCGGRVFGERESEAATLKRALVAAGIAPDRLLIEDRSRTTKENALNVQTLIPETTLRIGVVTGSFHLPRARLTLNSTLQGKELRFYGARTPWIWVPHLFVRECFTFWVDLSLGNLRI